MPEDFSFEEITADVLKELFSDTDIHTDDEIYIPDSPDDEEPSSGGVREPRNPLLPNLPGAESVEIEREEEFDLCICSN